MAPADALHGLLRLPGATYACVVERDTGRVLAEAGRGEGGAGDAEGVVPYSVARWGTAVAAVFDATSGDELDDVMITGRRSYHLVRSVGANASVLAYLRLDRARSNLAAARRELAGVRWGGAAGGAGRSAPAPPAAVPSVVPLAATPRAATPAAAPAPRRPPPSRATPPRRVLPDPRGATGPPATGPTTTGPAVNRVPAALPPTVTPGHGLRPVAGPASPAGPAPPAGAVPFPEPADSPRIPLPRRSRTRPPPGLPGAPRGAPEAVAVSGSAVEGFATPTVLGQDWARDPGTLRRLVAGLRRMS